jgi:hypothetical protein
MQIFLITARSEFVLWLLRNVPLNFSSRFTTIYYPQSLIQSIAYFFYCICKYVNVFEIFLQLLLYPNSKDPLNGKVGALML